MQESFFGNCLFKYSVPDTGRTLKIYKSPVHSMAKIQMGIRHAEAIASNIFFIAASTLSSEIKRVFTQPQGRKQVIVTGEMLQKLPDPVKRYLTYSGVVGKPMVQTVRLKQVGKIRKDATQPWINFVAKEYFSVSPPGFVWIAYMKVFGLPLMRVRDYYMEGRGNILVKALSLFTVADSGGEKWTREQ